jgi:putative transcriptional regulator
MSEESIAPALLVAMPQLEDPNFQRTVVLLIEHHDEGAFGVVLNRGTDIPVPEVCSSLDIEWHGAADPVAGWGGPVRPGTVWMLFSPPPSRDEELVKEVTLGVHLGVHLDALRAATREPPERLRVFLGYSGWGEGQLESELAQGTWLLAPVTPEVVFDVPSEDLWQHVMRSLGVDPSHLVATPGIH